MYGFVCRTVPHLATTKNVNKIITGKTNTHSFATVCCSVYFTVIVLLMNIRTHTCTLSLSQGYITHVIHLNRTDISHV